MYTPYNLCIYIHMYIIIVHWPHTDTETDIHPHRNCVKRKWERRLETRSKTQDHIQPSTRWFATKISPGTKASPRTHLICIYTCTYYSPLTAHMQTQTQTQTQRVTLTSIVRRENEREDWSKCWRGRDTIEDSRSRPAKHEMARHQD